MQCTLMVKYVFSISLIIIVLVGCSDDSSSPKREQWAGTSSLFSKVSQSESNIDFENTNNEKLEKNIAAYEYFYNGSGIAIGDIDNDGLEDLFFTGNMVPNRLYKNKGNLQFEDITTSSKISGKRWATGATMVDINNDGWLDIYVCNSGPYIEEITRTNQLFINNHDGTFTESAKSYGIDDTNKSTQASFFDYDLDGDLDLFVLNHSKYIQETSLSIEDKIKDFAPGEMRDHSCSLYRNDGNRFTDVTASSGILKLAFGLGVVTSDVNHDGYVDIYVANDFFIPDFLFINNKDGTFTDKINTNMGHSPYFSMGCDAADINNDGYVDLVNLDMTPEDHVRSKMLMASMNIEEFRYLTIDKGYLPQYMVNSLQINNGFGIFSEVGLYAGVSNTDWSWAALLADFDNDGLKDYYVTNGFKRDTKNNDWRMKVEEIRRNNNGVISNEAFWNLLQETDSNPISNYMYKNNGKLSFENVSSDWGLDEKKFSNGAAYADLDLDGDLDIVVNNLDSPASLYENKIADYDHNWLGIKFINAKSEAEYFNAKVTAYHEGGKKYLEYHPVRGFQSSVSRILHLGLGTVDKVDSLEIIWMGGKRTMITRPQINKIIEIDCSILNKEKVRPPKIKPPFSNLTPRMQTVDYRHKENIFDDFKKEILLPHQQSTLGPFFAVGDVNGDQLPDYFVGGAKGQSGTLYLQQANGNFLKKEAQPWASDAASEDMGSALFDADGDGDLDLYVASGGGGDFVIGDRRHQDRLYINDGNANFSKSGNALPKFLISAGIVSPMDYDGDGDVDIFVGGRNVPGKYPHPAESVILENENGRFKKLTPEKVPEFAELGMVTDAEWADINNDQRPDLIVVGEWMPIKIFINTSSGFQDQTQQYGTNDMTGWWQSVSVEDMNGDGRPDIIAGNIGENNKFHPKPDKPLHVFCADFDDNGTLDIVLSKDYKNQLVPVRGKECSTEQMPLLAEKFPTYISFSESSLEEIYGSEKLANALHYKATTFASQILINNGSSFTTQKLPYEVQLAPCNDQIVYDFNKDGHKDIVIGGNNLDTEAETPRYDAGKGLYLKGNGDGTFTSSLLIEDNGLVMYGNVKDLGLIHLTKKKIPTILVGNNNNKMQFFVYNQS